MARHIEQKALIHVPHFREGAIVEGQLPVTAKDRNRVSNMVQCFVMRADMLVEFITGALLFRDIERHCSNTA